MHGLFITFEGADGAGKSTQVKLLADYLTNKGARVLTTREPGGTPIGESIRGILADINSSDMQSQTEVFLYAAARAQITGQVIKPALRSGITVICDRFTDSTIAYQSFARGLPLQMITAINEYAAGGLTPDITFFLDIVPEMCAARVKNADRIELLGLSFQKRVYEGYKQLAAQNKRIITIGAAGTVAQTHAAIINELEVFSQ